MSDLFELLRTRRSVRRFRDEPLPEAVLQALVEDAITAPSASNKQPWRFLVVTSRERIRAMADAVRDEVVAIAEHVPEESREAFRAYGDYFTRFEEAPAVIVPIHRGHRVLSGLVRSSLDDHRRERIAAMERDSGLVGTSLALMNLLLAAHARDLGASAMTGPLVAVDRLRAILRVPDAWGIVALVPVGYPDEEPRDPGRKSAEKVLRWIR